MKPVRKAIRRSAPKVKSGCLTWMRRVKCDETKPACVKCTSTGRTCDGYDLGNRFRQFEPNEDLQEPNQPSFIVQQARSKQISGATEHTKRAETTSIINGSPWPPVASFSGTIQEQRSLGYFFEKTAPALGGFFDVDFWCRLLPRVAASEKSVQLALIAFAALHEEITVAAQPSLLVSHQKFSLTMYNKAIRSITQRTDIEGVNHKVLLLTCTIFTCLEFLRGMPELGLDHFQSGLQIFIGHRESRKATRNNSPASGNSSSNENELDDVDRGIAHAFSCLNVQASLVGRASPQQFYQNIEIEPNLCSRTDFFRSIQEARDSLNALILQSLRPINFQLLGEPTPEEITDQSVARYKLVASLRQWSTKLNFMANQSSFTVQEMDAIHLLRIQSIIALIWNSTTLSDNESQFDSYKTHFESVVSLASLILNKTGSSFARDSPVLSIPNTTANSIPSTAGSRPAHCPPRFLFALEMGIMFPLYFTAIKCRCPSIRRHATSLLFQVEPARQGIWDANILRKMSEYIIQFEEASSLTPVSCDAKTWPAEDQRIHGAYNTMNEDAGKRVQEVTFVWRPGGLGGAWMEWSEEIYY